MIYTISIDVRSPYTPIKEVKRYTSEGGVTRFLNRLRPDLVYLHVITAERTWHRDDADSATIVGEADLGEQHIRQECLGYIDGVSWLQGKREFAWRVKDGSCEDD